MTDLILVLVVWHRDAPFEVPGDAARLEASLEPSICCMDGVLAPRSISRGLMDVPLQRLLQQRELQEQVISLADAGSAPTDLKNGRGSAQERKPIVEVPR